ncbi:ParA family protein [Gammaproteobacteria bacterium AB-CW1]|uniref:ParA family protein n=1 Tax=Natronospira elongata TaxID=3110268 RepID=A0AAP6JCH0_9GAMM|nr:ParA family protein [Gammaproteobacteria bacterium AB-CW1]
MSIWAVANQKGGVGKTTTVISLAGSLRRRDRRVLVIDLDPHASLTSYLGLDPESTDDGVFALFQHAAGEQAAGPGRIRSAGEDGIDILPASPSLAVLDRKLGTRQGMGVILRRGLRTLAADYDHVLLDCPPMLGILMVNALAACDRLVIPVQTEFLALNGLRRMLRTLEMIGRSRGQVPDYLIVPTQFDRRTRASAQSLYTLRHEFDPHVWAQYVPVDTRFREASQLGRPLTTLEPASRGAQAYDALCRQLLEMEQTPARGMAS